MNAYVKVGLYVTGAVATVAAGYYGYQYFAKDNKNEVVDAAKEAAKSVKDTVTEAVQEEGF